MTYEQKNQTISDRQSYYGVICNPDVPTVCKKDNKATDSSNILLPVLTTNATSNITAATATSGGNITTDGGKPVTARGVCWSASTIPYITNNRTTDGSGTGNFTSNLTDLNMGTSYFVRAYATNSTGTAYGAVQTFTTGYESDESGFYGWMINGDEPDNAQWNSTTQTYDPCINPGIIIDEYHAIKRNDPSRPVYLNLGQGVAYNNYIGRGACSGNIDTYKISSGGYLLGCDIASFDIYPVNNTDGQTQNNLWYVATGIQNLISWSGNKPSWCWIETTRISDSSPRKPATSEVKSEVWMGLIHGAKGFGYFCHSFVTSSSDDAAVLHDQNMINAVKAINSEVTFLAGILNSPDTIGYATVSVNNKMVPVDFMTKNFDGANYIFAIAMRRGDTTASFSVTSGNSAEVLGEGRFINITNGIFSDEFSSYSVHLYKITN